MRLKKSDQTMIIEQVKGLVGNHVEVRLFGSRLDDHARGGDVDLLITLHEVVDYPAVLAAKISARLMRSLGGRKVDILLDAPNLQVFPIHQVAKEEGVIL